MPDFFSTSHAQKEIDKLIAEISANVNFYKKKTETPGQEKKGDYKKYAQQKIILDKLKEKREELIEMSKNGESYLSKKSVVRTDKKIYNIEAEISHINELIDLAKKTTQTKRKIRQIKKLNKKIESLKSKKGQLEENQIYIVDTNISKQYRKINKEAKKQAQYKDLERKIKQNKDRANQAKDTLDNLKSSDKKGIKKIIENTQNVGIAIREKFAGLVSTKREKRLTKKLEKLMKKDGYLEGGRKVSNDLARSLKNRNQQTDSKGRKR